MTHLICSKLWWWIYRFKFDKKNHCTINLKDIFFKEAIAGNETTFTIAFFIYVYENLTHFPVQNLPDFLKFRHFLPKICNFLPKTCIFSQIYALQIFLLFHLESKRLNRGCWYAFWIGWRHLAAIWDIKRT